MLRVTASIPVELGAALEERARAEDRSASAVVRRTVFELARVMGTSVGMIEHHYGALIDGAHAGIVGRLDTLEAELARAASDETSLAASRAHNGTPHRKGADGD
jgi:hypothetical protein